MGLSKKRTVGRLLSILLVSFSVQTLFAATVNVSGTVYVSSLADNAELKLTGATTLNIDVDKTIKSIRGDYTLTIQGSKTLTINNSDGDGIAVGTLVSSAKLCITASKAGLNINDNIRVTGGSLDVNAGSDGIYSDKGKIEINCNTVVRSSEGRAIYAQEDISLAGNLTAETTAAKKECIRAGYAKDSGFTISSISITGTTINVTSVSNAIYTSCGTVKITGENSKITSTEGEAIHAGKIDATGIGGSVYGDGNVELSGNYNLAGASTAIIAHGDLTLKNGGSITSKGRLYAYGNVDLRGPVDVTSTEEAIHAYTGNVSVTGNLVAYTTASSKPCIQAGYANNNGHTTNSSVTLTGATSHVTAKYHAIAAICGDINLSGEVTAYSSNGIGVYAMGVDATAIGGGKYTGDINVNGKMLYAHGKEYAVVSHGSINMVSPLAITMPALGAVKGYTIVDSDGVTATDVRISNIMLSGVVTITRSFPAIGDVVEYTLRGKELQSIDKADISTEWQRSSDGETDWLTISTNVTCTVNERDLDKYLRVKISAKGYEGYLLSSAVKVVKKQSTTAPEEPVLTVNKNNQIVVSNAKAAQEYLITTEWVKDFSTLNWNGSKTISTDGELNMGGTYSKVNYVYTRMKETVATYAGTSILMAEQYLGSAATMQRVKLTLSQYQVSRWVTMTPDGRVYFGRAGNPIRVTASSIPADATDFESNGGILGSQWVIDGDNCMYQGEVYYSRYGDAANFYSDYSCTKALEPNKYYKEAYLKPNLQVYDLWVGVGDLGFGDYFYLNVADSNGEHWLIGAMTNDVVLGKGETQTDIPMIIYPATASLNGVTATCDKDGAPTATIDTHYNKVTFDATNAKGGTYIFSYKKNGKVVGNTWVTVTTIEADEINVLPSEITLDRGAELTLVAQTFPSNSDSEVTWTSSDTSMATVDADGKVTIAADAQRGSTVIITATANGHEAACTITVPKLMPELSFSDEYTDEIVIGETFTEPVLNNPNSLTVEYTSSNTDVATVNSTTGAVTIVGAGYTTITTTFAGSADYEAGTAIYSLSVLDNAVVLADNNDNATTLNTYNGKVVNVTLQGRTLYKDGKWNTLTLPFDVPSLTGTPLEGATIMEMNTAKKNGFDAASGTLYLAFETATQIEAGKPYLVKWTSGADIVEPVFSDVTISSTTPTAVESATSGLETVRMVGNYAPVTVKADDQSIMFMGDGSSLYYTTEDYMLRNFRAYFEIPSQQSAPALVSSFVIDFDGDVVTGIDGIRIAAGGQNDGWYSLDGRRLDRKPTRKGVYIHNGNKVIVK